MWRLFGLSFLILFLELALIRWIPAYVRLVGYFSNLILLGAFLGIGLGMLWSKCRRKLWGFFPFSLILLLLLVVVYRVEIDLTSSEVLFFKPLDVKTIPIVEPEYVLPVIFLAVALVFSTIAQEFGKLFASLKPLTAYSIDIAGAILGILLFSIFAALSTPPWTWFLTIAIVTASLLPKRKSPVFLVNLMLLAAAVCLAFQVGHSSFWSPYYKVTVRPSENGYSVNVNNLGHQFITDWKNKEKFYFVPYQVLRAWHFKRILIIGAGTGNDTAIALAQVPEVEAIDAVEIDPSLVALGEKLHPNHPYADPRVQTYITDGRNFLERTDKQYDAILFALTDSLVLTSQTANIRLESFLFTRESFRLAKKHLAPGGVFILYNYYRKTWLVDKLVGMAEEVFAGPSRVAFYGDTGRAAVILAGPAVTEIPSSAPATTYHPQTTTVAATDDWPFIYLKEPGIPAFYLGIILAILLISLALILPTLARQKGTRFDLRFFLFGAAFMLLETKNLVTFGLIFGTTWIVNSLVFTAILTSVLAANLLSLKIKLKSLGLLYLGLFVSLGLGAVLPGRWFIPLPELIRYPLVSLFYFSPIFLANLLFSQLFRNAPDSAVSFGSNLLGAVLGGLLEYSALALGYRALFILIALCYLAAFLTPFKSTPYASSKSG